MSVLTKLEKNGINLNKNLPKSEKWFQAYYQTFKDNYDSYNRPLENTIPDVLNEKYKYVVEIDDIGHKIYKKTIARDIQKNKIYTNLGYKIIRIDAYNKQSLADGLTAILQARNIYPTFLEIDKEIKRVTIELNKQKEIEKTKRKNQIYKLSKILTKKELNVIKQYSHIFNKAFDYLEKSKTYSSQNKK